MLQSFDGHAPRVHDTAWVHEGAWVIGDVSLAAGASIWPTAVLRGDMNPIRVGEDTNIQDGAILHTTDNLSTTVVGSRVTVGHRAILHGCQVGDGCLIGMGAILLDNVEVGAGCLIGAGALVTQRVVIEPGSLVLGSPARVVRPLRAKERAWIDHSWSIYAKKRDRWRQRDSS